MFKVAYNVFCRQIVRNAKSYKVPRYIGKILNIFRIFYKGGVSGVGTCIAKGATYLLTVIFFQVLFSNIIICVKWLVRNPLNRWERRPLHVKKTWSKIFTIIQENKCLFNKLFCLFGVLFFLLCFLPKMWVLNLLNWLHICLVQEKRRFNYIYIYNVWWNNVGVF